MNRVLVVEDDPAVLRGLVDNLTFEGYSVSTATDGVTALSATLQARPAPDLVLLDLMLPKLSGYEVCRKLRDSGSNVPIIVLTARGQETDRVIGLDLGADDYITKPFSVRELLARVRAVLRRSERPDSGARLAKVRFGETEVDFRSHDVTRGGVPVELTRKEMALLRFLVDHEGEVVHRDTLLGEVWGYDAETTTRTVDNHIASLRAKVEQDPKRPRHLLTVYGVGYKWCR